MYSSINKETPKPIIWLFLVELGKQAQSLRMTLAWWIWWLEWLDNAIRKNAEETERLISYL